MLTFLLCLAALVTAYFTYGKYLERQAGADDSRPTPCRRMADGVDYIELPRRRTFLIQLLNIAGTGPIFGAILGACFGPVAFLWITLGGIFFGAMHDYMSGMMIVRGDGRSLPEIVGEYMGGAVRHGMRWFSLALMVLVGAVFLLSCSRRSSRRWTHRCGYGLSWHITYWPRYCPSTRSSAAATRCLARRSY